MTSKQREAGVHWRGRGGRSMRGLAGWVGIGVLVLGSAVACDSGDDSADSSSPSTEAVTEPTEATQTDSTESTDAPTTTQSPTTTVAAELVTMIDVEPVAVAAPFVDVNVGDERTVVGWMVSWQEGFLAVGAPGLPNRFPEEVAGLFPQEVIDLFPDGLPPTIGEATAILEEAGLYEVVSQIISANPDAYDLVFPSASAPHEPVFLWSEDGEAWTQLEGSFPDGMVEVQLLAGGGDHLVVAGLSPNGTVWPISGDPLAGTTVVSSTSDLINWTTYEIEPQLPAELPDGAEPISKPISLVANETGWVLEHGVSLVYQPEELLPPDLADRLSTEDLVAFADEEGVRIQPSEFDATRSDELLLTWEELGFDESLLPYLDRWDWGIPPVYSELWAATWTGSPVWVDTGLPATVAESGEKLIATNEGFLWQSDGISYSQDGLSWTELSASSPDGVVPLLAFDFAMPLPDGVAAFDFKNGGMTVYRGDVASQDWELIEVPGLPDYLSTREFPQGSPWIVDASRSVTQFDQWLVVTVDGERWLVDDLADDENVSPYLAALNGSVLLVGTDTGEWMRYDLAS